MTVSRTQSPSSTSAPKATNLAAVLHGAGDLRTEERLNTPPGPGEVQVQVKATGLCGSDLHYYLHGRNGDFALQHPMVLGHEAAGIVVAVGPPLSTCSGASTTTTTTTTTTTSLKVGDRVAFEAGLYCRRCRYCSEGRYNLCTQMRFASSAKTAPHLDGTLREYVNWPAENVHLMPDEVSYEQGALIEPLSVILHGIKRSRLTAGESVLVFGAGAVGLLACAAARSFGASVVACADIDAGRLEFARKEVGWAQETVLLPLPPKRQEQDGAAKKDGWEEKKEGIERSKELASRMLRDLGVLADGGFDVTFECTGAESCVQMGIFATRPTGRVVLVGMGTPIHALPLGAAALREVDLIGVFRYANTYPAALAMLAKGGLGKMGLERMISQRVPLGDAAKAFSYLGDGKGEKGERVVKVFVGDY